MKAVFVGTVLTATSVSITVETLRELGHLKGKVGSTILGAAIIDDILGIIVLTIVTSLEDTSVNPAAVFGKIALYFVVIAVIWFVLAKLKTILRVTGPAEKNSDPCTGILFLNGICIRKVLWNRRYYRCIFCRTDALLYENRNLCQSKS